MPNITEAICCIGVAVTSLSAKPAFKLRLCVYANLLSVILTFTAIPLKDSQQANYEHLGKGPRFVGEGFLKRNNGDAIMRGFLGFLSLGSCYTQTNSGIPDYRLTQGVYQIFFIFRNIAINKA